VIAHCSERIVRYKYPTVVVTVEERPKAASGKIAKVAVHGLVAAQVDLDSGLAQR
jgi:acyl-coenzyme A synthetase/AMP-(fatty) acid ligase